MDKNIIKSKLQSEIQDMKSQYIYLRKAKNHYMVNYLRKILEFNFKYNLSNLLRKSLYTSIIILLIVCPTYYFINNPNIIRIDGKNVKEYVYVDNIGKTDIHFLEDLAQFESSGKYNPTGNPNYHGKYQFGRTTLDAIGLSGISTTDFVMDTMLQEVAIRRLMKHNRNILKDVIGRFEGKTIGGVYITQSGLLAGAHLGGCGNIIKFIESNGSFIFKDGNGTPITKYIKHFGGYNLHF